MKIRKITTTEFNVPDGDYCQRADGSVDCNQLKYNIDFFGARCYCGAFYNVFHIPLDSKPLRTKYDIKKCNECARMMETAKKGKRTREDDLHKPQIKIDRLPISFAIIGTHHATVLCPVCGTELIKKIGQSEGLAGLHAIEATPNYCPQCGARLKEV